MIQEFNDILEKIEASLEKALPENPGLTPKWINDSFESLPENVLPEYIQKLIEPNQHLISLGGKRWRPLLLVLIYQNVKETNKAILSEEQVYSLTPLVEFVHTASLIQDDIEDSADLRRGEPAAHISYGLDTALNASSWLYFEAPVCINKLEVSAELKLELYQIYTTELRKLHLGQAMDIYWHRNQDIFPTLEEYNAMVKSKTGTLASLAVMIGCIAGGMNKDQAIETGKIAANIGMGFQIIDDVINLTTGNKGKKRGDDIVEGKKSLPVLIHTNKNPQDKKQIAEFMKQAAKDGIESESIENCIKLLESSGCIKEAAEIGVSLIKDNCAKLKSDKITKLFEAMIPEEFK